MTLPAHTDVVVVGAGLAGLAAARILRLAGLDTVVLEAGDAVGGRVRTDRRDGLLLDRGFQLLNPSYPQARKVLDLAALDLQPFGPGAAIAGAAGLHVVLDPRRRPSGLLGDVRAPVGGLRAKLAFAGWAAEVGFGPAGRLKHRADEPLAAGLARRGIDGDLLERVVRPFLAGVLAEDELTTSRRFGELLVRSFVRGTPSVPAGGMQAMPEQLAVGSTVLLNEAVAAVHSGRVAAASGTVRCDAVVVATDPRTAGRLLDLRVPGMKALSTFYFLADAEPTASTLLHLDGDRRGPIVNTAVVSNAAASYSSGGRALIAATVLGADASPELAARVRAQAGLIYGVDASGWDDVAAYAIPDALPVMAPPLDLRQPVALGDGLFVAGDHRDTASIQGALVSGRRAANAVLTSVGIDPT